MENNYIGFTKVKLPYGWLGNMSPYLIEFGGVEWKTSEALFQSLRFKDNGIKELIRAEKNPMSAKDVMKDNIGLATIKIHSEKDVSNMLMCLRLKLAQHPELKDLLIETGDKTIIEDVTARGNIGGNCFWGAMLVEHEDDFHWVGQNVLGKLWMDLRSELINKE